MVTDPTDVTRWKQKLGFHNRGTQWDTPMSKWAGEGDDWIQLMAQGPHRMEDVTSTRDDETSGGKIEKGGGAMTKKPRDLELPVLEMPAEDKKLMLEIRSDSKTIVDWVNGLAKLKTKESTIGSVQNNLREWWRRGVNPRHRAADWAVHIFREHNKEADSWARNGVKGHEKEWVDIAHVVWSEVTSL